MTNQRISLDAITIGDRHRKDMGDLTDLMRSIQRIGLLQPIVLDKNHKLIAGGRRIEAVRRLGLDSIPCRVIDGLDDAVAWLVAERDENTCRKPFTPSEMVELGRALEALERPKALARKSEGGQMAGRGRPAEKVLRKCAEPIHETTRGAVAKALGVSEAEYDRARRVVAVSEDVTAPKAVREVAQKAREDMDAGTISVSRADRYVRQAREAAGIVKDARTIQKRNDSKELLRGSEMISVAADLLAKLDLTNVGPDERAAAQTQLAAALTSLRKTLNQLRSQSDAD